ncbi:heterogeneous nuclear ribonucleoprotein 87F isoform X2 [Drosophila ficusphila]|uniref:heterogeneous nuclear ribonucleoprotein 87F isoform X2 n=1 Tax=Drosophila ficusphila TaxID=30025 RepID=UPI0007E89095|nr:heterogeneous nuclear ribonucleoprotein 87F isoform X2 [Drosophila ficusphila]
MSTTAKVFVGSLPRCKPDELRRLFSNYGSVVECDVMNRCAFVHLENTDMADAAIAALNGTVFKGQPIVVEAGRPKYGPGNGNRGPAGSGDNPIRRVTEGPSGSSDKRPTESGNNFKRNFREEAGGRYSNEGGGSRGPNATNNKFGPARNESNYRQRSAPYSKGPQQNNESSNQGQGFRNKFATGGKFGGNEGNGGRFGNNRFQQRDNNGLQTGRRNFKNSPNSGFGGGGSNSDFHGGSSGGGGALSQRGGGGGAGSNHVRQDRRGFALPVEHQQQQMGFGRFGNGPMSSGSRGTNGGNSQGGRGFFNGGGFNARRDSSHESNSQQGGGGPFKRGGARGKNNNQNGMNAYHSEFPPLGSGGGAPGQRNRFSGPRPGPNMGSNRRF